MLSVSALANSTLIANTRWPLTEIQATLPINNLANTTNNPATIYKITAAFTSSDFTKNHNDITGPEFIKKTEEMRRAENEFRSQSKVKCRHGVRKNINEANKINKAAKNGQATEKTERQLFDLNVDMLITKTNCEVICKDTVQLTPLSDTQQAVTLTTKNRDTTQHCFDKNNEIGNRKRSVVEIKKLITQLEFSGLNKWSDRLNNLEMHIAKKNISQYLDNDKLICAKNIATARTAMKSLPKPLHGVFEKIIDHCYKIIAADNNLRNLI